MDLKHQIHQIMGKQRRLSSLTQYKNKGQIDRFCDMVQNRYGLQKIQHLKTKHVLGVISELQQNGKSNSTQASYATAARTVANGIGKQNIVPRKNKDLGISRAGDRLKPVKADENGLRAVTARLHSRAEWLGLASEMRSQFGLRAKESLLSCEVIDNKLQVKGAKGGRHREVPIRTQAQGDLVNRLREHVTSRGQKTLVPADLNLKKALQIQRDALVEADAKKDTASHAHAARHAYAQWLAERGLSAIEIAEELGHSRPDVVSHYVPKG